MASDALTLAFIDARPAAAARALAAMAPEQAAAFLENVPARYVQRVAAHTSAWIGASILSHMSPLAAASALRELSHTEAASILRLMPAHVRAPLLQEAPSALRRALETSLSFAPDTVGAHMMLALIVLDKTETVASARTQIRHTPLAEAEVAFVVDEERRLAGTVGAVALLRGADDALLADLMRTDVPSLLARASLASAASLDGWRDHAALPVLNRRRQVIGALSRKAALALPEWSSAAPAHAPSIAAQLVGAFGVSAVELAALFAERDPTQSEEDAQA